MAVELQKNLGLTLDIEPGETGQFDIFIDDKVIYSKAKTGRFPNAGEVSTLLKSSGLLH